MRKAVLARLAACLALVLPWVLTIASAAAIDCRARTLGATEAAICQDLQLSRYEDHMAGRLAGLARRLSFGQYLGLRYWHAGWSQERTRCNANRACLAATYRAQIRFLDRLQQCLDTSSQRRACLRNALNIEREALRR